MIDPGLATHLAGGVTTLCRCWAVTRRDGVVLGFTDHDEAVTFEGITFRADTGMTAAALQHTTGLSVDNTEAEGALSSEAIAEADIVAGRYDGAEVRAWLVNWSEPEERMLQFSGSLGEVTRAGGAFKAELRGLAEALNHPQGRVYQTPCAAVLGDVRCGVDLATPGLAAELAVELVEDGRVFLFAELEGFAERWFERGRLRVLNGPAGGLVGVIKNDRPNSGGRRIELWERLKAEIGPGDMVRLETGCDKRVETCRAKFDNLVNYRGFPSIPGEDWLMAVPSNQPVRDGGSRTGGLT